MGFWAFFFLIGIGIAVGFLHESFLDRVGFELSLGLASVIFYSVAHASIDLRLLL